MTAAEMFAVVISGASGLAAFGALGISAYQARLTRFSVGVDLIFRLDERFEGGEMRRKRQAAARAIAVGGLPDVEDVLDFLETIGLLTRRKALDKEMVWSTFFYWVHGYYQHCRTLIEEQRKSNPTRYQDLIWLNEHLDSFEERRGGRLDESEWKDFLDEEEAPFTDTGGQ